MNAFRATATSATPAAAADTMRVHAAAKAGREFLHESDFLLMRGARFAPFARPGGLASGEQKSPSKGGGIEFADYREYRPGDDARLVDWSVFLRERRLMVKVCAEEHELLFMSLLDTSPSMASAPFGNPSADKLIVARRIAAILSGIALEGGNSAALATLSPAFDSLASPRRDRLALGSLVAALANLTPRAAPAAPDEIRDSLAEFASRMGGRCASAYLGDLLFPSWPEALRALASSGSSVHVAHILSPDELEPPEAGEITFIDGEDGSELPLHADESLRRRWKIKTRDWLDDVRSRCARLGLGYSFIRSDRADTSTIATALRKGGLLC